jgi:Domain of unknown function (DUF3471)
MVEAKVDPAGWDSLLGKYDYHFVPSYGQARMIMTITREGNQLFAQLTDQPKFEICPRSETEFFWKTFDAQITFVKNKQGKAIKAIHHSGMGTFDAPKLE